MREIMRFKATLALLSIAFIAAITIFEVLQNDDKPNVWERLKKKDKTENNSDLTHFEAYLARFGKSYKNKEMYNKRKREFHKTLQFI